MDSGLYDCLNFYPALCITLSSMYVSSKCDITMSKDKCEAIDRRVARGKPGKTEINELLN